MSLGGLLAAITGGVLGNVTGASRSSGSETSVPTPGEWDPDSKRIWDDAMAQIFGNETTPSLQGRMNVDDQYQRDAYTDFLNKSGASTQGYLNQIGGAANQYLSNPVSGSIGGQEMKWIPKSSARSYGDVENYARQSMTAQDVFNRDVLGFNKEYTPRRADMQYLNFLLPAAERGQNRRYGLPTTTTEANLNPSVVSDITSALEVASPWLKLFQKPTETGWYPEEM